MDKRLDKILSSYVVVDASEDLLERVILRVQAEQALPVRGYDYRYAAMFLILAFFGFWMGNDNIPTASVQTTLQYKYLAQAIIGPVSLSDFLL